MQLSATLVNTKNFPKFFKSVARHPPGFFMLSATASSTVFLLIWDSIRYRFGDPQPPKCGVGTFAKFADRACTKFFPGPTWARGKIWCTLGPRIPLFRQGRFHVSVNRKSGFLRNLTFLRFHENMGKAPFAQKWGLRIYTHPASTDEVFPGVYP